MQRSLSIMIITATFLLCSQLRSQNVGIETENPDSTLSINNKVEIGGAHGDILFTDDLGSITFPATTLPNAPMINMFSSGTSNADRMVISHSDQYQDWGLMYKDDEDVFRFGVTGSSSAVSIGVGSGHLAVGEIDVFGQSLLIAASSNDVSTGHFINTNSTAPSANAVYGSASGNGPAIKRAGLFEALQGSNKIYGVYATAALADTNIAVYGTAGYIIGDPNKIHRAGWFDEGDVVVDEQMLIGSSSLGDTPDPSALLELNSTSSGLLLPRMTAAERQAINNPAEGLVVYDTDSSKVFVRHPANWSSLSGGGGGGGGGGLWTVDNSPAGIFYSGGGVGIGDMPQFFRRLYVGTGTNLPYGLEIENDYTGGLGKYGMYVEASSAGTNTRYGIYSKAWANLEDDPAYGIYAEGNQGTTGATVYGIYATAPGTGSGDRWAGYFDGNVRATDEMTVDGSMGVGGEPTPLSRLYVAGGDEAYGIWISNNYDGGVEQFGLISSTSSGGSGARTGVKGIGHANSLNSASTFGVYGQVNQHTSAANVYGVYGVAGGSGSGDRWAGYFAGNAMVEDNLSIGDLITIKANGFNSAGEIELKDNDGTPTIMIRGNQSTSQGAEIMMADEAGTITLEIDSDNNVQGGGFMSLKDDLGNDRIVMHGKETSTQGADISMYNAANTNTIQLDADWGGTGDGRVVTDELEIRGGSDLAEYFSTSGDSEFLTPGAVVIIDPDHPGQVKLSGSAHDKKVVGIVSGANGIKPGMLMGQEGSIAFGDVPVAIAGRVYVKVDDSNGLIGPGDFLTTSDHDGKAMRVVDWEKARGAILGKALTCPDENGFVLVLVHLQ